MKSFTTNLLIAAAVVVLAAGSAAAQTLKADIPFTFHAAGSAMPPGTYQVQRASSAASPYVILRNIDTRQSVLAMYSRGDASKEVLARGTPVLQFQCSGHYCALSDAWTGSAAFRFNAPKVGPDGDIRIAEVRMTMTKAD